MYIYHLISILLIAEFGNLRIFVVEGLSTYNTTTTNQFNRNPKSFSLHIGWWLFSCRHLVAILSIFVIYRASQFMIYLTHLGKIDDVHSKYYPIISFNLYYIHKQNKIINWVFLIFASFCYFAYSYMNIGTVPDDRKLTDCWLCCSSDKNIYD